MYCAWSSCRHVHVHVCARLEQLLAEGTRHWRRQVPPPPLLPKGACREGAKGAVAAQRRLTEARPDRRLQRAWLGQRCGWECE